MSLDTFANLKTEIAEWLDRSDLTAKIPTFITLCEAEMKRRLRRTSVRTTMTISAEETTLASAIAELRSIHLETGSPSSDVPLRIGTPEMVAERRARNAGATGRPTDACVVGGKLVVAPSPGQSYTARIVYFQTLTPLSDSETTNDVLEEAPDAYLYGSLMQAEPYLEHDERIPMWEKKFDKAMEQLLVVRDNEEHGAALQGVRLPVVFN